MSPDIGSWFPGTAGCCQLLRFLKRCIVANDNFKISNQNNTPAFEITNVHPKFLDKYRFVIIGIHAKCRFFSVIFFKR